MPINWIVPARRLVVAEEKITHRQVADDWLAQLRQHRDVLLSWYRPLAPTTDLAAGFDRAVSRLEAWIEAFFAEPPPEVQTAAAPDEAHRVDDLGFWPRLWAGPMRVLGEAEASSGGAGDEEAGDEEAGDEQAEAEAPPDRAPIVSEPDIEGAQPVHLDPRQRIVLNHDAEFLPGDVLELPLFRLLWLAGVREFDDASFNGEGSYFLGTAVQDANGRSPGAVWLHDNLTAMRFQLLFNAARGAFYSFESSFRDRDQTRKTNPIDALGKTVHARGFTYGGSLLKPGKGSHFQCHSGGWGSNQVPTKATRAGYAPNTRLTTGWACNPSAMCLLTFMAEYADGGWGSAGGSVNGNARGTNGMTWIKDLVEHDFFHYTAQGVGGTAMLQQLAAARGLTGENITSEAIRELALRRLFGRPLPPRAPSPEAPDDAEEAEPVPEHSPAPTTEAEVEGEVEHDEVVRGDGTGDDLEDAPPPEADDHHLPEPTLDVAAVLPGNEEVSIPKAQMVAYMEGAAFAAVGLNGHEYSWVVVHPHDNLLTSSTQTIAGRPDRPPQTGKISVYDPLSGIPYVATDGDPTLFVFEATGSFHPCQFKEPGVDRRDRKFNFTVFKVRPFRWLPVDDLWLYRETHRHGSRAGNEKQLQVGESATYAGRRGTHVRTKKLLGVSRVSAAAIDERHRAARTFVPLFLHNVRTPRVAQEYETAGYASRAVPFPTLDESSADTRYATTGTAESTSTTHVGNLRTERTRLAGIRGRAGHLSAADLAHLNARLPGQFARNVDRVTTRLQQSRDARVRTLTGRIASLRRRLDRRYAPDAGQSRETQTVEHRQTFRNAVQSERSRRQAEGAIRRRVRHRLNSEFRLLQAITDLERTRRAVPPDWRQLAERVVIGEWMGHAAGLIGLLTSDTE